MKHLVLTALLVACGGNRVEDSGAAQTAPTPPSQPTTAPATTAPATTPPPPPTTPAKAAPMTTFMPTTKFREHAAKVLGIPPSEVEGGPQDATGAASPSPYTIGNAWGITVHPKGNLRREVRGWVNAGGTVITAEQNLGLLLAEVGVWTKGRKQTDNEVARKVAELLTWSYGHGYILMKDRAFGRTPPTLTLKPDGSGELVFFTNYKQSGPGVPGPDDFVEHRVVFKADQDATLTRKQLSP